MAPSTKAGLPGTIGPMADPDPSKTIQRFLGIYTQCEGLAEDIGYSYLRNVPPKVVDALLGRRAWTSRQVESLLTAVIDHEDVTYGDDWRAEMSNGHFLQLNELPRHESHREGKRQGQYHLVSEWKWATDVRNDLAHSTAIEPDPEGRPGYWELRTRAARHSLNKIEGPFTHDDLVPLMQRLFLLYVVLRQMSQTVAGPLDA